jgi:hypothetical protein
LKAKRQAITGSSQRLPDENFNLRVSERFHKINKAGFCHQQKYIPLWIFLMIKEFTTSFLLFSPDVHLMGTKLTF